MSKKKKMAGKIHPYECWANYETWVVNTCMEKSNKWVRAIFLEKAAELEDANALAEYIQRYFETYLRSVEPPFRELVEPAFNEIDWLEIAREWMEK